MRNLLWCLAPLALMFGCGKVAETCEDVELINADYEPIEAESGIRYCETDTEIDSERRRLHPGCGGDLP
ncbi:MAG: hypothetical protein IPN01_12405 [Deltaproteobacteria bacterium]|nr:hypothetical protein [Deltaproteobacteria bacterium]